MSEFVTFSPAQPTTLTVAAGQARHIADRGSVAIVGSRDVETVYVHRDDDGRYVVTPASLWPPAWQPRLQRILDNFIDD